MSRAMHEGSEVNIVVVADVGIHAVDVVDVMLWMLLWILLWMLMWMLLRMLLWMLLFLMLLLMVE